MHLPDALAGWLTGHGVRIAVIAALAYVTTRLTAAAARRFEAEAGRGLDGHATERVRRVQTLARTIQKALVVLVTAMAGLMILREVGVDITPVLTGAGVAGLAVGFGAQTLVRDVISGFFHIVEDQVRVGDLAVVNGQSGVVEELNLRTIVLRDFDGTVHIFPNGEVKTLANRSKDYSYAVFTVGVRADADTDAVSAVIRDASATVMAKAHLATSILEPVDVAGVEELSAGQLVIRARIKTLPLKQFEVGREVRRELAHRLAAAGIDLPANRVDVRVEGLDDLLKLMGPRG